MNHSRTSTRHEGAPVGTAIVVGGSLAGLLTSLTLARTGFEVTVLERHGPAPRTGGALQIADGLIERVTGWNSRPGAPTIPYSLPGGGQAWTTIHAGLLDACTHEERITLLHGTRVAAAGQNDDHAWVSTTGGSTVTADLVVGADGHRSVVRRAVVPEHPDATFAGYLIWLGMVDEPELPERLRGDRRFDGGAFLGDDQDVMFGYVMPGRAGARRDGHRQIGWAWYDGTHNDFLRANGNVRGNTVHHSVTAADIPEHLYDELADMVRSRWPSPWRDLMLFCIARRGVTGTPIAEYVPTVLTDGRLVIVGDAAHVHTPMTGQGFAAALSDAEALADALHDLPIAEALRIYENARLRMSQRLALSGQNFSRSFAST